MADGLPPIHDAVRFWQKSEAATLSACLKFRRTPLPGFTLAWLRHAAPAIMTRELTETALRHAVRDKVYPDSQQSVLRSLELFWRFVEKHQWKGKTIAARAYRLPSGVGIRVEPIGKYFSEFTKTDWIVALQPRQDEIPNTEQFAMWRSALFYEYCDGSDISMIVDLSKNLVSQKRELREITSRKYPLLEKAELDERLETVAACYLKAIEVVPERPEPKFSKKPEDKGFDF